ncbi:unnamed protein product [Spodoptera littoralis]|uniref:Uncharacterized protein n=1 Tax=Spodoptera littoralis TaxID=7109 RepID=A0A9P0I1H0_SPOLI|nr:unnamed protein product [Spodoptera littoralis]CAH1637978.1 unnamed protein product [Spodoptera littoralis]
MTRLLALLLIAHGAAEWVEISQQHYRKPIRTHTHFTSDKVIDVEDTTTPWNYNNHSVVEYSWNSSPSSLNIGNVKRLQHVETTTKVNKRLNLDDDDNDDLELNIDFRNYELGSTKPTTELSKPDKQKGTIERVSNLGNIKRVQLKSSPVKSPAIYNKVGEEIYFNNHHENGAYSDSVHSAADELDGVKNSETFHRKVYISNLKKYSPDRLATFPPDEDEIITLNVDATPISNTDRSKSHFKNHTIVRNFYSTKPTFITETEDFTNYETEQDRFYRIINKESTEVYKKDNGATEIINTSEDRRPKPNTKSTTGKVNTSNEKFYNFKAESDVNNVFENNENVSSVISSDVKTNTKDPDSPPLQTDHKKKEIKDKKDGTLTNTAKNENKVNAIENLINFMRVVADTISKNSRRNFNGKIQYLHELKDTILSNIEDRIDATWPDDDSAGARRRSRSAHATPRGHVHFPSSESALMTISFLTFAVFLIKLVLQVIHTYKNKAMMVAPLLVASGRNVFSDRG